MVDPSKIHWSNGVDKPIYADIIWVIWIIFLTSPWIWVKRIQMGYSTKLEEGNFGWVSLLDIAYGDYSVVKFNRISNPHWSLGVAIGLQPLINCLTVHVKAWITHESMTSRNSDARNDKKLSIVLDPTPNRNPSRDTVTSHRNFYKRHVHWSTLIPLKSRNPGLRKFDSDLLFNICQHLRFR